MSLYNMLFGVNRAAPYLISMLGLTADDIPRFRDCFLRGDKIVIYTRTGGGNRAAYAEANADLCAKPGFVSMEDAPEDSTYAYFTFQIPAKFAMSCEILREEGAGRDPAVEWPRLLGKLGDPAMKDDPEVRAVIEKSRPLMERLSSALRGEGDPGVNIIEV